MLEQEREAVAAAARRLAADGLVLGTSGNVSARAGEHVAITPTGAVLGEVEPGHVTVVDLEGRVAGIGAPRALDEAQRQAVVDAAVARGYGTTHRVEDRSR